MNEKRKRKIDAERRVFNPEWTKKYFFIVLNDKILCLLCHETISVPKEYNLRRHFESKHFNFTHLDQNEKMLEAEKLLKGYVTEQNCVKKKFSENEIVTRISFQISKEIATAGKSFTEGEFVKKCMLIAVSQLCPEKIELFKSISLSRMTVQRRLTDISSNLHSQLVQNAREFCFYSLAMDESIGAPDTAQLLIFIRGIDENFKITEGLAGLCSMSGRTTGKDLSSEVIKCLKDKLELDFTKLVSICTDSARNLTGINYVAVLENIVNNKIVKYPCIIHLQPLCSKVLQLEHVMSVVVEIVNYIRSRALKHRTFRDFLQELDADCGDMLYQTEVRWLSRGRILQRFIALKQEISKFLENEGKEFPDLKNEAWNYDLFFFCDITTHLNSLNVQLQERNQFVFEMFAVAKAFQRKLKLFTTQLMKGEMDHFSTCALYIPHKKHGMLGKRFANQINLLIDEFERRFTLSKEEEIQFNLIEDPFSVDPEELPIHLQLEVIELQCSIIYRNKHRESSLLDFYKILDRKKYTNLIEVALKTFCTFGTTYMCEQTFSIMNINKNKQRSSLSDHHLEDILKTATLNMSPEYDKLVTEKRCNDSH